MTNGVYASCGSFKTVKRPITTLTLLHGSIPLSVVGDMLRAQQRSWVEQHDFEFARKLAAGEPWPRGSPFANRVTHRDGERYIVQARRKGYVFWGTGQGDLPVFKENSECAPN